MNERESKFNSKLFICWAYSNSGWLLWLGVNSDFWLTSCFTLFFVASCSIPCKSWKLICCCPPLGFSSFNNENNRINIHYLIIQLTLRSLSAVLRAISWLSLDSAWTSLSTLSNTWTNQSVVKIFNLNLVSGSNIQYY